MITPLESALVVLIPEADRLIQAFRLRYEPSAVGLPAHVTILYPFKAPGELTTKITRTLRKLILKVGSFTVSFIELQRFPDMLYLAPEPAEPFRQLTEIITGHFLETPPYGGAFAEIIPHLTVAQASDPHKLDDIVAEFRQVARDMLPIRARVNTVTLMDTSSGSWRVREQFLLHPGRQAS
jgi:2'-5' RNA ligase